MPDNTFNVIGSISGWASIGTGSDNPADQNQPYPYTVNDLYVEIRKLIRKINPDYLTYLDNQLTLHLQDKNNPHGDTLEKMGTNVLNELYKDWKAYDPANTGTFEYFCKVLFQFVEIASIDTTLQGKVMDQVPSVRGVFELLKQHNSDTDSHTALFKNLFIGTDMEGDPSFALDATCGVPLNLTVTRYSEMSYINQFGLMQTALGNTLPIDFTFKDPMFSIWGASTNQFLYSTDLNASAWTRLNSKATTIGSRKLIDNSLSAIKVSETSDVDNKHGLSYNETISVLKDKTYAISFYTRAAGRYCCGIEIVNSLNMLYTDIRFDLKDKKVFMNENRDKTRISGDMVELGKGWFRCHMLFRPTDDTTITVNLLSLDIYDGDLIYNGTTTTDNVDPMYYWNEAEAGLVQILKDGNIDGTKDLGMDMCFPQFELGNYPSPYIYTSATAMTREVTKVSGSTLDFFNTLAGTIVIELVDTHTLNSNNIKNIFNVVNSTDELVLTGTFQISYLSKVLFQCFDNSNVNIKNIWTDTNTKTIKKIAFTYDNSSLMISDEVTPPIKNITNKGIKSTHSKFNLGMSRYGVDFLDGYIKKITYYPFKCNEENLKFLVETNHE